MKGEALLFEVNTLTPLMEQYYALKRKHPDAILLYRVGDFYETFGEDAIKTSNALGIVLTKRNNGGSDIELAGFPYHSLDSYLPKLVRAGYRVALCEQLEKPGKGKKVVKRGITEVVTPGITMDENLLELKKNNFLASVYLNNEIIGISFADISTGEFYLAEGTLDYIQKLIQSFNPSEIILARSKQNAFEEQFGKNFYTYPLEDWIFQKDYSKEKLLTHFKVNSLKGFGVEEQYAGQIAAGSIIHYLESIETKNPTHLTRLNRLSNDNCVWMDRFTIRNLELIEPIQPEGKTLLSILDQTLTPMGSRLIRKWLVMPLIEPKKIQERLDIVSLMVNDSGFRDEFEQILRQFGDLERLVSKIPLRRISPREINHILKCLSKLIPLEKLLRQQNDNGLNKYAENLKACSDLKECLEQQLLDDAPNVSSKGGIFKQGFSSELDELKYILTNSKDLLLEIQKKETIATGIGNLKIGFNSVFGYYLEVTNKYKNQGLVPDHWIRKQTMSTGERYVTEELKNLEVKILGAEERIIQIESELFESLVDYLQDYITPLQQNAQVIAHLDSLYSLAKSAVLHSYCKPEIDESLVIDIKDGRHPVIEHQIQEGEQFIPNDIYLDSNSQQILMITGPNMSGKSAILRQTALICLMAQIGSFVPAKDARLGVLDRIFTRVGASDNISSGESTFMVEMNETSSILNNVSARSLILLDEIGRGTSTYDGISIAWAVAEYLHELNDKKAKVLFATHYHELNELSSYLPRIHNFHVATKEHFNKVIFLRKLIEGGSEHSFGIHVAQMAGMPSEVIKRASELLHKMESNRSEPAKDQMESKQKPGIKISMYNPQEEQLRLLLERINQININTLTPVESLLSLIELQKEIRNHILSDPTLS